MENSYPLSPVTAELDRRSVSPEAAETADPAASSTSRNRSTLEEISETTIAPFDYVSNITRPFKQDTEADAIFREGEWVILTTFQKAHICTSTFDVLRRDFPHAPPVLMLRAKDFRRKLLRLTVTVHSWANVRTLHKQQTAMQLLEDEIKSVVEAENEQGMSPTLSPVKPSLAGMHAFRIVSSYWLPLCIND
ncbi:hypothetical protein BV22DRAFT_1037143 [Leucogyrophana mollusca]|uniref:Uncharacterized protein n=1 Tax=Leucogyrophana mollusca TaxID=85980 RepID=A0ACB8BD52_9AGAM|nr:hypothetical protein BV22DRAFT_1037143 [Leucogyrophana mollusca]